jgi:hypothetical protein|tara:strand:+ start:1368 stop:1757 length:390 start_codon:yes stop_codon:yes gene_type:complete
MINIDELRQSMEIQYRHQFYNSPEFPFLQSIGVDHIIQGFEAEDEVGFIGVLHLWWVPDPTGTVLGIWESEWFDRPEAAIWCAIKIQKDRPYDEDKLIQVVMNHCKKMAERSVKKMVEDHLEDDTGLLN